MDIAVTQSQGLRNRHSKDNELNLKSDTFNKSNLNDKLDIIATDAYNCLDGHYRFVCVEVYDYKNKNL